MTTKLHDDVVDFHRRFGHPIRHVPTVPPNEDVRFRLALMVEEFLEMLAASTDPSHGSAALLDTIEKMLRHYVRECSPKVDLPNFADALADLAYVIEGTAVVCGLDMAPIHDLVHAANMAKEPAYVAGKDAHHLNAGAKPRKPEGWKPPDVEGELRRQLGR